MSRIILVVGLPDSKSTSKPSCVYLGRSGVEMQQAIKACASPRLLLVHHVTGIPKNNPRAAANAADAARAQQELDVEIASVPDGDEIVAALTEQNAALTAEIASLKQQLSGKPTKK